MTKGTKRKRNELSLVSLSIHSSDVVESVIYDAGHMKILENDTQYYHAILKFNNFLKIQINSFISIYYKSNGKI
jgi:hypothetical protein